MIINWLFKLSNVLQKRRSIKKQIGSCNQHLQIELKYASPYNMDEIRYLSSKLDDLHKQLNDTHL